MRDDPWAGLGPTPQQIIGNRVGGQHALSIYWVRSPDGSPGLLLRGIDRGAVPSALPRPRGLAIAVSAPGEQPAEAGLYLQSRAEQEVFVALCRDVISYSSKDATPRGATSLAFRRIEHWHSLLNRRAPEEMGPQEVRGLIGELWVLLRLSDAIGMAAALQSWVAPDDHPQDFATGGGVVEVKTRLAGSRPHARISSLEQLEESALPLHLLVVELAPGSNPSAFSLNEIAQRVLDVAEEYGPDTRDAAALALLRRGHVEKDAYDVDRYTTSGARLFRVDGTFPRLTRSRTDRRIHAAQYTLDLTALDPFECPLNTVLPQQGA
ncbi:PD-(D/E)XK motif protein [Coralloluteibacterium stylophorae]|uniref:PD-(D/E)XK motif protein n=1 Tax=Coralloluteibacterium stylophorae TaxID=1776034 RepID=A0AAP2CAG5_9GAMM|nr:PD-(D/E)XK motif protein [Coralloluteibacterium stylophorae]MBS7456830.1 PD-(D/E)XK motif protein [Coralloluteibacterium stylophorae]